MRVAIRSPENLLRAIRIAKQNIEDGTVAEVAIPNPVSRVSFTALAAGEPWDDFVEYQFRCSTCGELFSLHAETYHGSGGYWEPVDSKSVRENL